MENNIIELSIEQREVLERFVKTGTHNVHLVNRARVILMLDRSDKKEHLRINRICERVGISRQAINDIRKYFLNASSVEEFLKRKKRETPPVPPKITGDVEAQIIALACSNPPKGNAKWSLRLLEKRIVELKFFDSISYVAVHSLLKKRNISLT
jgi:phage anti-repressor protein